MDIAGAGSGGGGGVDDDEEEMLYGASLCTQGETTEPVRSTRRRRRETTPRQLPMARTLAAAMADDDRGGQTRCQELLELGAKSWRSYGMGERKLDGGEPAVTVNFVGT